MVHRRARQQSWVMLGMPGDGFGRTVAAETRTYRDAKSGTEVRVNHARLTNLSPDTDYIYAAVHDGATPNWAQCGPPRRASCVPLHQLR